MTNERIIYLYRITCTINGKIYIGQTVNPDSRWYAHRNAAANPKVPFHFAIKKYGAHNFEFEVIASCKTQDDANQTETDLVKQYDSFVTNGKGYNATHGGMNVPKTEEWKKNMSAKLMKHEVSNETRQKMSESKKGKPGNRAKGSVTSDETRQKMSESKKGKPGNRAKGSVTSDETKLKLSLALKGRKAVNKIYFTEEQILAIKSDIRYLRDIAKDYGVSTTTIVRIKRNEG